MNRNHFSWLVISILILGCQEENTVEIRDANWGHRGEQNRWMVESPAQESIGQGVIRQHTLYSYQFQEASAELTPQGQRDLKILAENFRAHPGPLNIARGNASESLYLARIQAVRDVLEQQGVDMDQIIIGNELPGGDGIASMRLRENLENEKKPMDVSNSKQTHATESATPNIINNNEKIER